MTTKRANKPKQWPPIHELKYASGKTGWQVACQLNGKRIRETFPTRGEAETRAEQIRAMVQQDGAAAFTLPAEARVEAGKCLARLQPYGASLTDAVNHYVDRVLKFRSAPTVNAVIEEIVEAKRTNGRRERTVISFASRCRRFAETFGTRRLNTITVEEVRNWLTSTAAHGGNLGAVSRVNYLVCIGDVFNYGVKHGYCDRNPVALIDRPSRESGDVHFLTVEQVNALLVHAEPWGLVAYVALGVFAGLRPEKELRALSWQKINLAERTIRIDASLAKTRARRVVEISEALAAYLAPFAKRAGLVMDKSDQEFRKAWEGCRRDAGITPWPHDVMRHTFATYHLAAFGDIGRLSLAMGNSPQVIHSAYKGLVSKADAERFRTLRPAADAAEKMVAMKVG